MGGLWISERAPYLSPHNSSTFFDNHCGLDTLKTLVHQKLWQPWFFLKQKLMVSLNLENGVKYQNRNLTLNLSFCICWNSPEGQRTAITQSGSKCFQRCPRENLELLSDLLHWHNMIMLSFCAIAIASSTSIAYLYHMKFWSHYRTFPPTLSNLDWVCGISVARLDTSQNPRFPGQSHFRRCKA